MPVRSILLGGCLILAVLAVAADEPPDRPEVHVDTVAAGTITGRLRTSPIRLEDEHGVHEIRPQQIRRITFRPRDAETGHDVIELADKSHVEGHLLDPAFSIDTDSGIQTFTPGAIREIKA